jgi:RimJ/RimL family protein N-acetyltransferase
MVLMIETDNGAPVGTMGLHSIDHINGTATTGAMFGNTSQHNKGIGKMAKMVLLDYAFNILRLRQIYSEVISFNHRSRAYSEKCGYKLIATLPEMIWHNCQYYDKWILVVTMETWLPLWEKFQRDHNIETFAALLTRHGNVLR